MLSVYSTIQYKEKLSARMGRDKDRRNTAVYIVLRSGEGEVNLISFIVKYR